MGIKIQLNRKALEAWMDSLDDEARLEYVTNKLVREKVEAKLKRALENE